MSTKLSIASMSVALLLAVAAGWLYVEWTEASEKAMLLDSAEAARRRALAEADRLRGELERSEALRKELARELEGAKSEAARAVSALRAVEKEAEASEAEPAPAAPPRRAAHEPYVLASLDEAESLARSFLEKNDIERLWLLAADLVSQGEEGYRKLAELWEKLDVDRNLQRMFGELWDDDMLAGPFLRMLADRRGEFLRFGLWLQNQDPSTLPKFLGGIRKDFDDDIGPVLIGAYEGEDAEVLNGWLDYYRKQLSGDISKVSRADELIHAISQIRTPEAGEVLLDIAERAPANRMEDVIRALAWQGGEGALLYLRSLAERTTDPKQRKLVEEAIRYLE